MSNIPKKSRLEYITNKSNTIYEFKREMADFFTKKLNSQGIITKEEFNDYIQYFINMGYEYCINKGKNE